MITRIMFTLICAVVLIACTNTISPNQSTPNANIETVIERTATSSPSPIPVLPSPQVTTTTQITVVPQQPTLTIAAIPTAVLPTPQTATIIPADTATIMPNPTRTLLAYVFPVDATQIDYGKFHHDYPATDIFCPIGSKFVAPTDGIVDFVSREDLWDPATNQPEFRGGLSVAIVGDDGWRYYGSHLSEIAAGIEPGVRVRAGDLLGLTGKSGNARGTPPHLHFGISHPTTPEDWEVRRGEIPPYRFLKAWQNGEYLIPSP